VLRIGDFERGPESDPVAILRQTQLLARGVTAGCLRRDRLVRRPDRQITALHIGPDQQRLGPDTLVRILLLRPGLCQLEVTAETVKDRKRDRQSGLEWLAGKVERKCAVCVTDLLRRGRSQGDTSRIQTVAGEAFGVDDVHASANLMREPAQGSPLLATRQLLLD